MFVPKIFLYFTHVPKEDTVWLCQRWYRSVRWGWLRYLDRWRLRIKRELANSSLLGRCPLKWCVCVCMRASLRVCVCVHASSCVTQRDEQVVYKCLKLMPPGVFQRGHHSSLKVLEKTRGRVRAGPSLQLGTLSTRIASYTRIILSALLRLSWRAWHGQT